MSTSNDSFLLIQSLSSAEKRYFKLYVGQQSENKNYMRVFKELEKQTVYDEAKLLKRFKGEKLVKSLHVTKKISVRCYFGGFERLRIEK